MNYRKITTLFIGVLVVATSVWAITPGDDLLIAGAARVNGWQSDLYINNPGDSRVTVNVMWLIRNQANPTPTTKSYFIEAEETLILTDVLLTEFNLTTGEGAFRITADGDVTANLIVYVYKATVDGTLGSGFEAIPASSATSAGETTFVMGLAKTASFYTNIFALAGANGVTMELDLLDPDGAVLDTAVQTLEAYEPWLSYKTNIWDNGNFTEGTLRAKVTSGSAAILGSKVDKGSQDPTTLESAFGAGAGSVDGVYQFSTYDSLGFASGGQLEIANGLVLSPIYGTYSNFDKVDNGGISECTLVFYWGVGLDATPVGDFASGTVFTDTYFDESSNVIGQMTWTVTFTVADNIGFSGTVDAVGSGWSGSDVGCNGTFPTLDLEGGKAN